MGCILCTQGHQGANPGRDGQPHVGKGTPPPPRRPTRPLGLGSADLGMSALGWVGTVAQA